MNTKKKLVALVLVMLTVFTMTASALATTNGDNDTMIVYVTVNETTKPKPDSTTETVTQPYFENEPVEVSTTATVYELVQAMSQAKKPFGYDACWKDVPLVDSNGNPTGQYGKALVSLSLHKTDEASKTETYVTRSSITTTTKQDVQEAFCYYQYNYSGSGWTYKVNDDTADDTYMDSYNLAAGDKVTLSYCTTSDSWRVYYIPTNN